MEQALVVDQLLDHQADHLFAQHAPDLLVLVAGALLADGHTAFSVRRPAHCQLAHRTLGQALHHRFDQLEILQGDQRGRYRVGEILHDTGLDPGMGLASEQATELLERLHRALDLGLGLACTRGSAIAGAAEHRLDRTHALRAHPLAGLTVQRAQSNAHRDGRWAQQVHAHVFVGNPGREGFEQGPHESLGLERVECGLHRAPAQQGTDQ